MIDILRCAIYSEYKDKWNVTFNIRNVLNNIASHKVTRNIWYNMGKYNIFLLKYYHSHIRCV